MSIEKSEICQFDRQLKVTLKDLRNSINRLINEKQISESAKILWAASVTDSIDDPYKDSVMPGSILLGLEWIEDGEIANGTMRVEPPLVGSKYIN